MDSESGGSVWLSFGMGCPILYNFSLSVKANLVLKDILFAHL